jgi:hypothetical protein
MSGEYRGHEIKCELLDTVWGRMRGSIPKKEARFTTTRNLSQHRLDQDILVVPEFDSGVLYLYRPVRAFGFIDLSWMIV